MIQNRQSGRAIFDFPIIIFGLIVALNLLFPYFSNAQQVRFELFTPIDGLAGNNTSTVAQDELGFLWFINDGKMHRFDGRNF